MKTKRKLKPLWSVDDFYQVYSKLKPAEQIAVDDLLYEIHNAFPSLNRHERQELLFKLALYLALFYPKWQNGWQNKRAEID